MFLKHRHTVCINFLSFLQGTFALGRLIAIPCATRFTAAFMLLCNLVCISNRFVCSFDHFFCLSISLIASSFLCAVSLK